MSIEKLMLNEGIKKLGWSDPVVAAGLRLCDSGRISYVEALEWMVLSLAAQKEELNRTVAKLAATSPCPITLND